MKRLCAFIIFLFCMQTAVQLFARKQWTEKQAWNWQKKVGVIKGFNQAELLKALAFRYGKPVFCTSWKPVDQKNADETIDNFSRSHTYWYQAGETANVDAAAFRFRAICTPH